MASPPMLNPEDREMAILRSFLFRSTMKGEWKEVVETYETNPKAYEAKIANSGDTALHLAVRDEQEEIVEQLVEKIPTDKRKEVLSIANDQGNTVLHIAAAIGNARMCRYIAHGCEDRSELVGLRNRNHETPFFLASLFGKIDAFLCLHRICGADKCRSYYRNGDGETILHVAIEREYFELAFQIIMLYRELAYSRDEKGISPLHVLATKPNAFRSGTHLGGYRKLIYHSTFVDKLKKYDDIDYPRNEDNNLKPPNQDIRSVSEEMPKQFCQEPKSCNNNNKPLYPENYETCINFLVLPQKIVQLAMRCELVSAESEADPENLRHQHRRHKSIPTNYHTCFDMLKFVSKALLVILGLGSSEIRKLRRKKEKHTWSFQVLEELLERVKLYEFEYTAGKSPQPSTKYLQFEESESPVDKENKNNIKAFQETEILIAAKHGITEIVEKILEKYPVAIHDMNSEQKNVVLLAVENRQPHVYQLLLKRKLIRYNIFDKVDDQGNSALHLAARLTSSNEPWRIPGAALQMQWEFKWYEFVKTSMPRGFFFQRNKLKMTPKDIFNKTHKDLVKQGGEWLTHTSESCSVVAALIATVAFATSATVPGGVNQEKGTPTLEKHPAFNAFAISSLVALCFSVTSVVMFLSILTSRYQERDFRKDLPKKLLVGLSSLFVSISAVLVSFCAGHFFVLKDELKYAALPVYAVTCLPVTLFAIAQFPLYVDLVWATFKKVPQRRYIKVN